MRTKNARCTLTACLLVLSSLSAGPAVHGQESPQPSSLRDRRVSLHLVHAAEPRVSARATRTRLAETYAKQSLIFEPNQGQAGERVQFLSGGLGYSLFLTPSEAVLAVQKTTLRMTLTGANRESAGSGLEEITGKVNYFIGNDPGKWRTDIRTFAKVKFQDVYPGVDLIYYGNQRQLEYDFIVAPGANPKAIRLAIDGASSIRIDRQGDLVLKYQGGAMRFHKPVAYQTARVGRTSVDSRYVLLRHNQVGFEIAAYDANKPLVIDPVVTYSTYLGGDKDVNGQPAVTDGFGITVDPSGNIYVAGSTDAINDGVLPILNAFQPAPLTTSVTPGSAFVAKLDAAGNPVYVTYLGGNQDTRGLAVAADANGVASVTGWTSSSNFPVTPGAFQSSGTGLDSFMTRFGPTGGLLYSTYVASGRPGSVAVDVSGNTYLTGSTDATFSGKTTQGAYRTACAAEDTYILKLSPANPAAVLYASCLASKNIGRSSIAVDAAGNIYVAGGARTGTDFLVKNGFQTAVAGAEDAFVAKLFPGGAGTADLLYSTLFGGSLNDGPTGIAVDGAGSAYIAGNTGSADLPVTLNTINPACLPATNGVCAAFVAKFDTLATGAASRIFATYLGGSSGIDDAEGIAVDSTGNAFVAGFSASSDFPTLNPLYGCPGCALSNESMFLTEFSPMGVILFSTFLGGSSIGNDDAFSIHLDGSGNVYLTGESGSESLPPVAPAPPETPIPACMNPIQSKGVGTFDAFVVKISPGTGQSTTTAVSSSANPSVFGQLVTFTASVKPVVCTAAVPAGTVTFLDGTAVLGTASLTNGTAPFPTSTLSLGSHSITASYGGSGSSTASSSAPLTQTVNQAATTTALSAAPNPANAGQNVLFTATVGAVPPGAGVPTGTVTFSEGATTLYVAVLTNGAAPFSSSTLSVGSHTITAAYGGDADFTASASSAVIEQVHATAAPPVISKAFGSATILQGGSTSLSFTINNPNATAALTGVGFSDGLPIGLVIATPNGLNGSCGGGSVSAAPGSFMVSLSGATLAGGGSCTFSVNVTGLAIGPLTNTTGAVTSFNGGNGNTASAALTVVPTVVLISVPESIHVTDAPMVPSLFINLSESITVTDAPAAYNTPSGNNIAVQPVDTTTGTSPVSLTFSNVTQPGLTSLTTIPNGPPPPTGFQLGSPPEYFELSTTAVFSGTVAVCINYNGITFSGPPALFHFENGAWVNVTTSVDTVNKILCGLVTSFSRFALFQSIDTTPPLTTATPSPAANPHGWNDTDVTITLSATDNEPGGTGVKQIQFTLTGAQTGGGTVSETTATTSLTAEGATTLTYFATDNAGNHETPKTLTIRIDKTPPVISGMPGPGCIVPTDHHDSGDHGDLVQVATITAADSLSGLAPGSFQVTGTTNQPSQNREKPQIVITPNASGGFVVKVRADGSGDSPRVYTLTATATDLAGNTATVTGTCTVPNDDQGSEDGGSRHERRDRGDR